MTNIDKLVRAYRAEMIQLGFNVRPIRMVGMTTTARGMGWCYHYSDGTVKEFRLDSHDKILDEYDTYHFFRINVNHISFLDTPTNGYLVDHNHFTFYFH